MVEQWQRQLPAGPGPCRAGRTSHGSLLQLRPDHEGRPPDRRCGRLPARSAHRKRTETQSNQTGVASGISRFRTRRHETKLMATPVYGWERGASLREWLLQEPYRFEFYQAVRLLEAFRRP